MKEKQSESLRRKIDILMKLRGYEKKAEDKGESIRDITVLKKGTDEKILIRIVTKSRLISGTIGVRRVREMKKGLEKRGIKYAILVGDRFSYTAKVEARKKGIELFTTMSLPSFNIFKHELVPKHEIVSEKEVEELMSKYRIKPYQLPWIKASDPVAKLIGAKPGDVLKIARKSPTAGSAVAYRYVIE